MLARLLLQASRFAHEAYAETLARFAADRATIADRFLGGADPGEPVVMHSQLGAGPSFFRTAFQRHSD